MEEKLLEMLRRRGEPVPFIELVDKLAPKDPTVRMQAYSLLSSLQQSGKVRNVDGNISLPE